MADLTTLLSKFLTDLYAGTLGVNNPITSIAVGDGSASAPSLTFASEPTTGVYRAALGDIRYRITTTGGGGFTVDATGGSSSPYIGVQQNGTLKGFLQWDNASSTLALFTAANIFEQKNGDNPQTQRWYSANSGCLGIQSLSELTTIAAAATTDTTIQMPAGAIVLAVSVRTTVVIPTATSYSVGDSGSATRFSTANVGVAANSTDAGTKAGAYYNASALAVRLTMNGGTPAANSGRVRVTIYYLLSTPPTS